MEIGDKWVKGSIPYGYGHSRRSHCDQVVIAFLSVFTKRSLCYIDFK
jgi:hypothetical protein